MSRCPSNNLRIAMLKLSTFQQKDPKVENNVGHDWSFQDCKSLAVWRQNRKWQAMTDTTCFNVKHIVIRVCIDGHSYHSDSAQPFLYSKPFFTRVWAKCSQDVSKLWTGTPQCSNLSLQEVLVRRSWNQNPKAIKKESHAVPNLVLKFLFTFHYQFGEEFWRQTIECCECFVQRTLYFHSLKYRHNTQTYGWSGLC